MQHRVVLTIDLGKLAGNYRAVCGVAAPILFLVGASQQKRALLASQSQAVRW